MLETLKRKASEDIKPNDGSAKGTAVGTPQIKKSNGSNIQDHPSDLKHPSSPLDFSPYNPFKRAMSSLSAGSTMEDEGAMEDGDDDNEVFSVAGSKSLGAEISTFPGEDSTSPTSVAVNWHLVISSRLVPSCTESRKLLVGLLLKALLEVPVSRR